MTLSNCKHCGSPAGIVKSVTDPHYCWSVACGNVDACGIRTGDFSRQQDAIDAWNRHAYSHRNGETEAPTVEGYYFFDGDFIFGKASIHNIKEIVRVNALGADMFMRGDLLFLDKCIGQWWGPIALPWEGK